MSPLDAATGALRSQLPPGRIARVSAWLLGLALSFAGAAGMPVTPGASPDPFCQRSPAPTGSAARSQTPETRRMVERLARLRAEAEDGPNPSPFLADRLALEYQRAFDAAETAGNAARLLDLRPKLARQLLNAGRTQEALRHYRTFRSIVDQATWRLDAAQSADLAIRTAVAYLRLGEQENCLAHHNPESCVFPLKGGGVHTLSRGARSAIGVLESHLRKAPGDLQARWLLNLAHMAVGDYPRAVPSDQLIPPSAFASEYALPRFIDVAGNLGVDVEDLSGGVIAEDFDGDGFIDLMVSASGLSSQLRYFHNDGNGAFTERTAEAGLTGLTGGLNLLQADFDNDGHTDVLVLRGGWLGRAGHHPNSLLRNRGDGAFDDVTASAGLLGFHPTQTAVWFDFDGDGRLDLFVGNESTPGDAHACELFRNNGNGTFTECAARCGLDIQAFVKGVVSADYDRDGRPDLYLSTLQGTNRLLRNDGPVNASSNAPASAPARFWSFTDRAQAAGVIGPRHSFPTWFWDYDNDGRPDLFVCGYAWKNVGDAAADALGEPHEAQLPRLYHNQGDGTFADVTAQARLQRLILGMGANFGDFDNDGWLDFYVGTGDPDLAALVPNRAFRNAGDGTFQDVGESTGLGHLQKGHGVAFADFDNDGDQDIYIVLGGALTGDAYRNALFLNPGTNPSWLRLELQGTHANRSAIGAEIEVVCTTASGTRSIHRTVGSGGSFGASPLRQEIGLGRTQSIRAVRIRWSGSGSPQVFHGLVPNRSYRLVQDRADPIETHLRPVPFHSRNEPHRTPKM